MQRSYRLVTLKERYGDSILPKAEAVDMKEELKAGNRSILSRRLYEAILDRLKKKQQIMTGKTGFILRQDHKGIYVQTGEGILCLDEVQLEGRKRMPTSEFLKGYVIRNNDLNR